jgi:hypothetical protein
MNVNIIGKYDKSSVDIEGSADSLREFSQTLQGLAGSEVHVLPHPQAPPTPYLGYVKSLKMERSEGNVCVSLIADEMVISGSPEKLMILAGNIRRLAEQQGRASSDNYNEHLHIEYHPDHFYLKEESIPLVVTKRIAIE